MYNVFFFSSCKCVYVCIMCGCVFVSEVSAWPAYIARNSSARRISVMRNRSRDDVARRGLGLVVVGRGAETAPAVRLREQDALVHDTVELHADDERVVATVPWKIKSQKLISDATLEYWKSLLLETIRMLTSI